MSRGGGEAAPTGAGPRTRARQPPNRHRAPTSGLEETRRIRKTVQMLSDTEVSCTRNSESLGVSPLEAVVTHKVRTINDFAFEAQSKNKRQTQRRHSPGHRPLMFVRRGTIQITHGTSKPEEKIAERAETDGQGLRIARVHIPGVQNTLAGGISRWPHTEMAETIRELTNSDD